MRSTPLDTRALRTIHGQIAGNGTQIVPGSGDWWCTRSSTGVFVVRFAPFKILPTITVTSAALAAPYLVDRQYDWFQVNMYLLTTAGTLTDAAFTFHAEGR